MARRLQSSKETILPKISPQRAIDLIRRQIERLDKEVLSLSYRDPRVEGWISTSVEILNAAFGMPGGDPERRTRDFMHASSGEALHVNMSDYEIQRDYTGRQQQRRALLEAYIEQLQSLVPEEEMALEAKIATAPESGAAAGGDDRFHAIDIVKIVCSRLHLVARQLRHRHEGRPTLQIGDEYDVQDLLHSLLRLHFDDIRPEEWTPSYGGGSARMDFLLKAEEIVVEAKMARPGRDDRKISEELIVDAARYREHGNCKILVCLIYDREGSIRNPRGVERDLENLSDSRLQVIAIIVP